MSDPRSVTILIKNQINYPLTYANNAELEHGDWQQQPPASIASHSESTPMVIISGEANDGVQGTLTYANYEDGSGDNATVTWTVAANS
ncbi:hypothetical protein FCOIX_9232 [Fusarium coicis]|nr:hypothetical protein FCOIX_9232 [Fusarium coicis]